MEWMQGRDRVWVVGHRGAKALWPENTMLSFEKAIALGVDGIETDVHMTADGHLVLMHDLLLDRTTNGHGSVEEKTLAELRRLDAGSGERIPLLSELLDLVKGTDLMLNVEMKDYRPQVLDRTIAMLADYGLSDQYVIACFDCRVTTYAHERYGVKTQGFLQHDLKYWEPGCERHYYSIGTGMKDVSSVISEQLRAQGIDPWCWCPDTEEAARLAIESGFTLMTCNDPRPALKIIKGIDINFGESYNN
ncbi:MAG: glycerophosphodiester phosphodiesterase [Lachnospiraceae bacterium]|jgi:glycerophosphoryl diester phosphodiesterase|nr:glycerophosphodiester phosphodiesterase [Lachnospiraceae bacterium]